MNKVILSCFLAIIFANTLYAQRGYHDAPYQRYESDLATLSNGAFATSKSYNQNDLQSEASDQKCVNMTASGASVAFTLTENADGLVIRYSIPDNTSSSIGVYADNTYITSINLSSYWSWEYLWVNDPGITNHIPRMRFDEVRYKLPNVISTGQTLKLVQESGAIHLDFVELELVPNVISAPENAIIYTGNGSNLLSFINTNGGQTIYLPPGIYNVPNQIYFDFPNTKLQGAGMWHTQIHFTATTNEQGGLRGNSSSLSFSDLYLTTANNTRSNSYKAISGVFTGNSVIENVWAEHFECGGWIAQYASTGPAFADNLLIRHCRFRNNYADGLNFAKGTSNSIAEHCNFRNNGDDDQATWSANGQECVNNTFRYNTSEHCWRASGIAVYGGKNHKAHHLIIKDNLEAGIRVNNNFPGVGFNATGMHEFYDITVIGCGTFNDLFNNQVGAVDIFSNSNNAGTQVRNVSIREVAILDSKNDAIMLSKKGGDGIYNLSFENIYMNGTGKEFPHNNVNNLNWGRGYFVLFAGNPNGNATYCNLSYLNRGGNAGVNVETFGIGTFSWTSNNTCSLIYNVSTSSNPSIGGISSGDGSFANGSSVTVNATANNGYSFVKWSENENEISTNASYTFTISGHRNLVAEFSPALAIDDFNATKNVIAVYPNPTNSIVNFSVHSNVQISNVMGQIIANKKNVNAFDMSGQPAGIYFLTLTKDNGEVLQHNNIIKK